MILDFFKANLGRKVSEYNQNELARFLGGTLVSAEEGSLTFEHVVEVGHLNPLGWLHGGIAATFMDDVIGATVYSLEKGFAFVSLNLNVDYLAPAKLGDVIKVKAEVIKNGSNIIHLEATIVNAEGRLLAKATSNMAKVHGMPLK